MKVTFKFAGMEININDKAVVNVGEVIFETDATETEYLASLQHTKDMFPQVTEYMTNCITQAAQSMH